MKGDDPINSKMTESGNAAGVPDATLVSLADQVRARLTRIYFREWMRRGAIAAFLTGVMTVLALRFFGHWNSGEVWVVLALLTGWIVAGLVWAWWKRPGRLESLMVWDERSGAKDMFSSALFFEQKQSELSEGEKSHQDRAKAEVADALAQVEEKLPLPSVKQLSWMLVLVLAFALSPLLRPGVAGGDQLLSDEMVDEARRQGFGLAEDVAAINAMEDLSEAEKKEAKKLEQMVGDVAEELGKSEGKSAREVLEALEERARAAERLAKKLGAATDAWASDEMLKEMSQHADLAELSAALKDKNAQMSSAESDRLEAMLEDPEIKVEVQQRMTTALTRTMGVATDEDRGKPVGEHVGNATRKMESKQPKPAARDFGRLADHFRTVARREAAQEKMQQLADKLRKAGSEISGSKLEQMEKLAGNKGADSKMPKGMKPLQTGKGAQKGASMANSPINQQNISSSQLPIPGIQNQPLGAGQMQQGGAAPVPGSKNAQQGQGKGQGQAMAMGKGQGKGNKPGGQGLMAPVPGQGQGQMTPGAGLGGQQGNGAAGGSAVASAGGQEAGSGTTNLGADKTAAQKAVRDSTVTAQINKDGESTMRAVQGKSQQESAQRERQQAAVDFIKVEEEALDERALPVSRRDHVLKYFTTLRKRFEENK